MRSRAEVDSHSRLPQNARALRTPLLRSRSDAAYDESCLLHSQQRKGRQYPVVYLIIRVDGNHQGKGAVGCVPKYHGGTTDISGRTF